MKQKTKHMLQLTTNTGISVAISLFLLVNITSGFDGKDYAALLALIADIVLLAISIIMAIFMIVKSKNTGYRVFLAIAVIIMLVITAYASFQAALLNWL